MLFSLQHPTPAPLSPACSGGEKPPLPELAAVTALYDFVDDWFEVQRAVAGRPTPAPALPPL